MSTKKTKNIKIIIKESKNKQKIDEAVPAVIGTTALVPYIAPAAAPLTPLLLPILGATAAGALISGVIRLFKSNPRYLQISIADCVRAGGTPEFNKNLFAKLAKQKMDQVGPDYGATVMNEQDDAALKKAQEQAGKMVLDAIKKNPKMAWGKCKKGSGEIVAKPVKGKIPTNWDGSKSSRAVRRLNQMYSDLQEKFERAEASSGDDRCARMKQVMDEWERKLIPQAAFTRQAIEFSSKSGFFADSDRYLDQAKMFEQGSKDYARTMGVAFMESCSYVPEPDPGPTPDPTPDPSPDPSPDPKPDPSPRPKPSKRCGKPGSEYGQRGFVPAKKKSAKGDSQFDKFYADLEANNLLGKLGRAGKDYKWGRKHRSAYRALLCKMDAGYKPSDDPSPAPTPSPEPEKKASKYALCTQVSGQRIREWNKNRQKFNLPIVDMQECDGIAFMNDPGSPYQGLTRSEIDKVTSASGGEKKAGISAQEAVEAREDAQRIYDLAEGFTDSDEEQEITAIVEKHLQKKSIGLLFNFYDRVLAKENAQDRGDLVRELYHEDLPDLAKKVRVALQRETRGKQFRSDYEPPVQK